MARPMKRPPVTAGAGAADTNGNQERRPVCWMSFCRKGTMSSWPVAVAGARWRVEHPAARGFGRFGGSSQWQHDDYGCASECQVYEDYQCERRGDQCERLCMSGVSHVLSLRSGGCVSDLPIVSNGHRNATPECVGSVSSLLRKERRDESNTPLRTRDVTAAWLAYSSKIEKTCRTGHDKRERVKCDKLARMACAVNAHAGASVGWATNDRRAIR
jgi:hypothetical protein